MKHVRIVFFIARTAKVNRSASLADQRQNPTNARSSWNRSNHDNGDRGRKPRTAKWPRQVDPFDEGQSAYFTSANRNRDRRFVAQEPAARGNCPRSINKQLWSTFVSPLVRSCLMSSTWLLGLLQQAIELLDFTLHSTRFTMRDVAGRVRQRVVFAIRGYPKLLAFVQLTCVEAFL